jgi:hypothetical protein
VEGEIRRAASPVIRNPPPSLPNLAPAPLRYPLVCQVKRPPFFFLLGEILISLASARLLLHRVLGLGLGLGWRARALALLASLEPSPGTLRPAPSSSCFREEARLACSPGCMDSIDVGVGSSPRPIRSESFLLRPLRNIDLR